MARILGRLFYRDDDVGLTTEIAYCDSTVNPVVGCMGCELYDPESMLNRCYAATLVNRYAGIKGWPSRFTRPEFFAGRLERAIAWPDLAGRSRPDKPWLSGYPRIVFLNNLGDTFSPNAPAPETWLLPHLDEMSKKHIWLFLTKWPRRMREFFERVGSIPNNFWLGKTITSTATSARLGELIRIGGGLVPTPTLWLSFEPLLSPVDLTDLLVQWTSETRPTPPGCIGAPLTTEYAQLGSIGWVVAGGESGRAAYPMHPDWVRDLRDDCQLANVPFFFKQWGELLPRSQIIPGIHYSDGEQVRLSDDIFIRTGKQSSGDVLDGMTWHQ